MPQKKSIKMGLKDLKLFRMEPTTAALTVIRVASGATTRSIPHNTPPRHGCRLRHHHP